MDIAPAGGVNVARESDRADGDDGSDGEKNFLTNVIPLVASGTLCRNHASFPS